MKQDRAITLVAILAAVSGLLAISVGKFIMGGIIMLLAFGILWNRGGGRFNDRSIYEKVVKTDLSIEELYSRIREMDTPLGQAWTAEHRGYKGDSIVFGPDKYKDCVVISRSGRNIDIKHITLLDNIIRRSEDEYRFKGLVDAAGTEVTPARYSDFAVYKLASVMLIAELKNITELLDQDRNAPVPASVCNYTSYYHNSSEGHFRDSDGYDLLRAESSYQPFSARILSEDGEEMASVIPRAFNAKGIVVDSRGYELRADGEHFGEITRSAERNGFEVVTDAGTFTVTLFPANVRANMAFNYYVEKDGELKAVIGGSPNILFDTAGRCQNDVILSCDDDYLVLYAALEIFIMTLNKKFLK